MMRANRDVHGSVKLHGMMFFSVIPALVWAHCFVTSRHVIKCAWHVLPLWMWCSAIPSGMLLPRRGLGSASKGSSCTRRGAEPLRKRRSNCGESSAARASHPASETFRH